MRMDGFPHSLRTHRSWYVGYAGADQGKGFPLQAFQIATP